jgi:integrase
MAEKGIPMAEIAQYLGHTNPMITYKVYARYSPDYLSTAASALEV